MATNNTSNTSNRRNRRAARSSGNASGSSAGSSGNGNGSDAGNEASNIVSLLHGAGRVEATDGPEKRRGFLTAKRAKDHDRLVAKSALLTSTAQKLAEASDYVRDGGQISQKASAIVNEVGLELYQGRADGIISADEVSNLLGNQFGFKMKGNAKATVRAGDKNASKTPAGDGEEIRKRIRRAVAAFEYVNQDVSDTFFEGLDKEAVRQVIEALPHPNEDGVWETPEQGISLWAAYSRLADVKKDASEEAVPLAFNFRRIAAINAALEASLTASLDMFRSTPGLSDAYAALVNTVMALDAMDAETVQTGTEG